VPALPYGVGMAGPAEESPRRRLRIDLGYDGGGFAGWARQPGLRTVEGMLSDALDTLTREDATPLVVAGRTDAGVHARRQVCHVDVPVTVVDQLNERRLNGLLPPDVRVHGVGPAAPGFDARFSATHRSYCYRLADEPAAVDPLRRDVLRWPRRLDVAAMAAACPALLGLHDFAAFCRARTGATTIRTLLALDVERSSTGVVEVGVRADAFCHSMVRGLVGALVGVGEGRHGPDWPAQVLARARRDPAVRVLPPGGLTLEQVAYPVESELAARAERARAMRAPPETAPAAPSDGGRS